MVKTFLKNFKFFMMVLKKVVGGYHGQKREKSHADEKIKTKISRENPDENTCKKMNEWKGVINLT